MQGARYSHKQLLYTAPGAVFGGDPSSDSSMFAIRSRHSPPIHLLTRYPTTITHIHHEPPLFSRSISRCLLSRSAIQHRTASMAKTPSSRRRKTDNLLKLTRIKPNDIFKTLQQRNKYCGKWSVKVVLDPVKFHLPDKARHRSAPLRAKRLDATHDASPSARLNEPPPTSVRTPASVTPSANGCRVRVPHASHTPALSVRQHADPSPGLPANSSFATPEPLGLTLTH